MAGDKILLAGIPAAGKSHLGSWMEESRGFIHFDVERDSRLREHGLEDAWRDFVETGAVGRFSYLLAALDCPIVFNWGFPPRLISVVQRLSECGFTLWWLGGDWVAARAAFDERNSRVQHSQRIPSECFDVQRQEIDRFWPAIQVLFLPRIVEALAADGSRMPPEEIYARLSTA